MFYFKIKYYLFPTLLCLICYTSLAISTSSSQKNLEIIEQYLQEIVREQQRIDLIDGIENHGIAGLHSGLYFELIDSIAKQLRENKHDPLFKAMFAKQLLLDLRNINKDNYQNTGDKEDLFGFLISALQSPDDHQLTEYLSSKPIMTIKAVQYFKYHKDIKSILFSFSGIYPAELLKQYDHIRSASFGHQLLDEITRIAPSVLKEYLSSPNIVRTDFEKLQSQHASIVKEIFLNDPADTKTYSLLEAILNNGLPVEEAYNITREESEFLKSLIQIYKKANHYAGYSIKNSLRETALETVRGINHAHDETDMEKRFYAVKDLTADQIYAIIIFSGEEIFTSTFNGLYSILNSKLETDTYKFLQNYGFRGFRSFLKLCSEFNKLENWVSQMHFTDKEKLYRKFVERLEDYTLLQESITVADAIGNMTDEADRKLLNDCLNDEIIRVKDEKDHRGSVIYHILLSITETDGIDELQENLNIADITTIKKEDLFSSSGKHIQQHFFYDDEDGRESFQSFLGNFSGPSWEISDFHSYILISSRPEKSVELYINKPEFESEGQDAILNYFSEHGMQASMIVHRGHSYYAEKTIEHITQANRIVVMGSCGGYNLVSKIVERAPGIHIISSKQIAGKNVNNPILTILCKEIRKEKDLDWFEFWQLVEMDINKDPATMERFKDYIPPHKNLAALFKRAYDSMMPASVIP